MKTKTKLRLFQISSIFASVTPLAIFVGINHEIFFADTMSTVSISLGLGMVLGISALTMLGKISAILKANKSLWIFGFLFAISILLEPIIVHLKIISAMVLIGEGANLVFFQNKVNKLRDKIKTEEVTDTASTVAKEIVKELNKGGRV